MTGPAVDLDLAFSAEAAPPPALSASAGVWADPQAGAEPWHALLSGWLRQLAPELPARLQAPAYSLGLGLVDDTRITELNAEWRGQAAPTDVLAFAARDEGPDQAPPLPLPDWIATGEAGGSGPEPLELGDIVISLETAARQAGEHGHDLVRELQFLASHGLLHLLGWDHPDPDSLAAMLARQERLLTPPGQPG
ncbi:MAG: rRNA maturation RNase YbeY [Synechococcaceae cyanobacterium]